MSSPLEIINSTDYIISGEVSYMTVFCSNHYFFVKPHSDWKSEKRGICPIIEVSATVRTPRGLFAAQPYISIGTTHSLFEVVQIKENVFKVLRVRNSTIEKSAMLDSYNPTFLEKI